MTPRIVSLQVQHLIGMCKGSFLKVKRSSPITLTHNESSSVMSRWHMQRLSPQGLETESNHPHAQRVFKCHVSLAYAEALSSKSKDRVRLPLRTTSLQALYHVDMCKGFLLKVERPSPITLTYNESSSVRSCWRMQKFSLQALKKKEEHVNTYKSKEVPLRIS